LCRSPGTIEPACQKHYEYHQGQRCTGLLTAPPDNISCLGNGALYLVRLIWINGLVDTFAGIPFALDGGGDPVAVGFAYGNAFLYTAGLMNLLAVLDDGEKPPDSALPDTGVGLQWERILSPIFITSPEYGTRSSSVVLFARTGRITFVEQTFVHGEKQGDAIWMDAT